MTREDTIIELKWALQIENKVTTPCIMTAIKSLEAWDKVVEEIEQLKIIAENEHNVFFKAYIDGMDKSLEIINKHLGEVEE